MILFLPDWWRTFFCCFFPVKLLNYKDLLPVSDAKRVIGGACHHPPVRQFGAQSQERMFPKMQCVCRQVT